MPISGKQMLKLLLRNGWVVHRINGSHHTRTKGDKTIVVPVHAKDLGKGLESKLMKEAGLK
jgi:predicted RNA binding protein YcfA (HicA-like mRNA interferase family)